MIRWADLFGTPRTLARELAVATGLGALLGVLGPFGSYYGGPLELRLFYWIVCLWVGFLTLSAAVRQALKAGSRLDLPVWFAMPLGVAVAAAPLALVLDLFSALVFRGRHARVGDVLESYGQTLAIAEPSALLFYWLGRPAAPFPAAANATATAAPPSPAALSQRFEDRLSGRLGRDLLCLQMEDHYVRAHTAGGSELILLSLKDAVAELGAREGLQVHRSWWVAREAVAEVVRDGRNLRLRLTNGVEAPVSRSSLAMLREAGWLA